MSKASTAAATAAALAGLLGLAACDQGPATVTAFMHPSGAFDFLIAATRNQGPLYLELDGSPFADDDGLDTRIATAMEPALQSRVLSLTTDLSAAEDPRFRLVLVFNAAGTGELMAFCAAPPAGGAPEPGGRVELRAGFCRGDEKFAQLLRQVARDNFSRHRNDD